MLPIDEKANKKICIYKINQSRGYYAPNTVAELISYLSVKCTAYLIFAIDC